jgi:hypothetical protein
LTGPKADNRKLCKNRENVLPDQRFPERPAQTPHIQTGYFTISRFGEFRNMALTSTFVALSAYSFSPNLPREHWGHLWRSESRSRLSAKSFHPTREKPVSVEIHASGRLKLDLGTHDMRNEPV